MSRVTEAIGERRAPDRRHSQVAARAGSAFRLYVGGNAIVSWYVAMTDPRALMHLVASTSDGAVLVWAVMLIGAWALVDAIINDVLPAKYSWRLAFAQRHFVLAGMAFCYMAQLYIAYYSSRPASLLVYYTWNAVAIMVVAFIDAHQRAKDQACKITAA